jgi:hypothetical protein
VQRQSFRADTEKYFRDNGGKPKKKKVIMNWEIEEFIN